MINSTKNHVSASVTVWVDVYDPVIYLEVKASKPIIATATYENWRTENRVLSQKEALSISYKTMPNHTVKSFKDNVSFVGDKVLFYHRNKDENSVFDFAVHQQKLDAIKDSLHKPLKTRTYGGMMYEGNLEDSDTYIVVMLRQLLKDSA